MKPRRILFLDDDVFQTKYNVAELEKDFIVDRYSNVDDALSDIVSKKDAGYAWAGAVLDIMMPPGQFAGVSPDGMETGWHFFKELRKIQPKIPVIVITNLGENEVQDWFEKESKVKAFDKATVLPDELLKIAKESFLDSSALEA